MKEVQMGGYVMQIQNFSVNDGEGLRTNLFLAGCPLRCAWCSNPEGQTMVNAMTRYMTVDEVIGHVKKQMIFYSHSGGGVTFSGGEATVQADFLRALTEKMYDMGISLAIETCGYFEFSQAEDFLRKMDMIFLDLKHMDRAKHEKFTGMPNKKILDNVAKIVSLRIPLVIRIPVIHGVNTDQENMTASFAFIKKHAPEARLELLPYHTFGESKYEELKMKKPSKQFSRPSPEEIAKWEKMAGEMGIEIVNYK